MIIQKSLTQRRKDAKDAEKIKIYLLKRSLRSLRLGDFALNFLE